MTIKQFKEWALCHPNPMIAIDEAIYKKVSGYRSMSTFPEVYEMRKAKVEVANTIANKILLECLDASQ